MPLFNRRQSSSASAVVTIGTVVSAVNTNTLSAYTFSSVSLGAADAGRVIVVGTSSGGGTNSTVSGLTVGGVSAVEAVELQHQGDAYYRSSLWIAEVPTGTTGDVVVTMSGSTGDCGIIVWPTTGASHCAYATASDASDAGGLTVDLNVEADGAIIAYSACDAGPGWSWTGLTEDIDETVDSGWHHSGASAEFESASTPQTVTCVPPGSSREGLIALSLSPVPPAGTAYRYFRLNITANNGHARGGSIGELEIFAGPCEFPAANMTSNTAPSPLVASASNEESGLSAWEGFNNSNSGWATQTSAGVPQWLQIDLGSGNDIAPTSFSITENSETPSTAAPKDFTLSGSDDGNFSGEETVLKTVTGQTSWSDQEVRTYTI